MASALAALLLPAIADAGPAMAVLGEKDMGFKTLAECEQTIGRPERQRRDARAAKRGALRGSLINRAAGNITRCALVDGEPLIVVTPKGS